jgi:hypothetical protein
LTVRTSFLPRSRFSGSVSHPDATNPSCTAAQTIAHTAPSDRCTAGFQAVYGRGRDEDCSSPPAQIPVLPENHIRA